MIWDIGFKRSGTSLVLAIHRSAMVRWRKRLMAMAEPPRLVSIATALQSQPVEIGVDLGRGTITLAELEQLAIGDVILLDRSAQGPVTARVAGQPTGLSGRSAKKGTQPSSNSRNERNWQGDGQEAAGEAGRR